MKLETRCSRLPSSLPQSTSIHSAGQGVTECQAEECPNAFPEERQEEDEDLEVEEEEKEEESK